MITAAAYLANQQLSDNQYRVRVQLTDSVLGVSEEWFVATANVAADATQAQIQIAIREDISRQIAIRNGGLNRKNALDGIAVGTNIPVTYTPPAPAAPTVVQLWAAKVRTAAAFVALGTIPAGALATRRTAIVQEIRDDYEAANPATRAAAEALL